VKRLQNIAQGIVIALVCGGMLVLVVYEEATPAVQANAMALVGGWSSMGGTALVWLSYACAALAVPVFALAIYKNSGNGGGFMQSYRVNIKD